MSTMDRCVGSALSLESIVAFNDELEALVRAGVPLERGLLAASADYRGRLGRAIRGTADRLAAGEALPDAVTQSAQAMPEVYRALITAGVRSGRLAESLQGMSRIGQAAIEARRTVVLAFLYPLIVLGLAYTLFLFCLVEVLPRFVTASAELGIHESVVTQVGQWLVKSVLVWGPIPPLILIGCLLAWRWSGRARTLDGGGWLVTRVDRLPLIGRMIRSYRAANFADLLAHLIDHEVPLDQAVRLAGNAAGNGPWRDAATHLADQLASGELAAIASAQPSELLPPLVVWMLTSGSRQDSLTSGLRHLATSYRRTADRQATAFRIVLPGLMILTLGAGAVLAYALLLFVPLSQLWNGLASPL